MRKRRGLHVENAPAWVTGHVFGQELEGNEAVKLGVFCFVDNGQGGKAMCLQTRARWHVRCEGRSCKSGTMITGQKREFHAPKDTAKEFFH